MGLQRKPSLVEVHARKEMNVIDSAPQQKNRQKNQKSGDPG
jgi:hypothetical protein